MPVDEVRLGLVKKSDKLRSGFVICGYLWIVEGVILFADYYNELEWNINDGFWSNYRRDDICDFDKLIHFSPFPDKNGRLLKEGDRIETEQGSKFILEYVDGSWFVDGNVPFYKSSGKQFKYTGNIFLED